MRARGSASTSAHHSSVTGSCGCDHERRSTAARAFNMAETSLPTSGKAESSRVKFGGICSTTRRPSLNVESAAFPERLGLIASGLLTGGEGKALAIYPVMECFDNRKSSKKYFALVPVFHAGDTLSFLFVLCSSQ